MELEVERALEKKYQELVVHQMEMGRIIESLNSLLPETERFNIMASGEALDKLVEDAREKAIRAVLEQYKNSNVGINVKEISKELDKICNKCFNVSHVKMIFGTYYYAAKDSLKKLLFKEADRLMPWKLESAEQLVKNKSLILRHSVTECSTAAHQMGCGSSRAMYQTLRSSSEYTLKMLIREPSAATCCPGFTTPIKAAHGIKS